MPLHPDLQTHLEAQASKNTPEEYVRPSLWLAADKLRNNMDAAEYQHVALGLIFLTYTQIPVCLWL